mgnify:CR=1 FL=1
MSNLLREIYEADQTDRQNWTENKFKESILEKDRQRRAVVKEMVETGQLQEGIDYFYASMVFQHGEVPEDYLMASELARKAVDLGEEKGLWMIATSEDRYLTYTQAPYQKYGTQYRKDKDGESWYLYPIDPETTDEERAKYNVPPLEELKKREKEMNKI